MAGRYELEHAKREDADAFMALTLSEAGTPVARISELTRLPEVEVV